MKVLIADKEEAFLNKGSMRAGCVYINKRWPKTLFLAVGTLPKDQLSGVVNLHRGEILDLDIVVADGWTEVDAEVHVK